MKTEFNINGFTVEASYFQEDIDGLFLPLLQKLKGKKIVYLAAPPGAGKTTLSKLLARLSGGTGASGAAVQAIGIDGFHYPQEYIKKSSVVRDGVALSMQSVKGCPESFDLPKLRESINQLREGNVRWPIYDRNLHDVVPNALEVRGETILIEGNWLLLDEPNWRELATFCDYSIFVSAPESLLQQRLINRKITGGSSQAEAQAFYTHSDGPNVQRALKNRLPANCELSLFEDGKYAKCGS